MKSADRKQDQGKGDCGQMVKGHYMPNLCVIKEAGKICVEINQWSRALEGK